MKIKQIRISNYLGIEKIGFEVGEAGAAIEGDSRKGKTSILDAIVQTIANTSTREKIVRDGTEPAKIYIKMDNGMEILRYFSPDGKKGTSVSIDGLKPSAPETYLKKLLGDRVVLIDPNMLLQANKDKELSEMILSLLPIKVSSEEVKEWFGESLPVDCLQHGLKVFKDIEAFYYSKRTDVNRTLKAIKSTIETTKIKIPVDYNRDEWEKVVLSELFEQVRKGIEINNTREQARFVIEKEDADVQDFKNAIEANASMMEKSAISKRKRLQGEILSLEHQIQKAKSDLETLDKGLKELQTKDRNRISEKIEERKTETKKAVEFLTKNSEIDVEKLQQNAVVAETMKGFIPLSERIQVMEKDHETLQSESDNLTKKLSTSREKPIQLLQESDLPITDLSIDENGAVLIKGLPITNLSTSEIVELLCDIEIAKTSEVQFVCADRWESLGDDLKMLMKKKFMDAGIQLFYTNRTSGDLTITAI